VPPGTLKITYTSGTTGQPKGVCLDAEAQLAVAESLRQASRSCDVRQHLCVLPLATLLRQRSAEHLKMMECIKTTLLSSINGYAPQIAVEFGRKTLFSTERPSFAELEDHVREVRSSSSSSGASSSASDAA